MAGHSKWANIKHRKAAQDKKRGKLWSKCARAIMAAARHGGGDPVTNLTLRYAIDEAKAANMPKDTIQRAIDKATGEAVAEEYAQVTYEGYGPGGAAIIVDALTDNRTRTVNDVRLAFSKYGGSVGNPGAVSYMFKTRGRILIDPAGADEERIIELALEAGAADVQAPPPTTDDDDGPGPWTVDTEPAQMLAVREALLSAGLAVVESEVAKVPDTTAALESDAAVKLLKLIDLLEDNDDVQKVYHNAIIPDEAYANA